MIVKVIVEEKDMLEAAKKLALERLSNNTLRVVSARILKDYEDFEGIEVEIETDPSIPLEG